MENEQAVIGALLIDGKCLAEISDALTVEDFALDSSKAIFRAAHALDISGKPIDAFTIKAQALSDGVKIEDKYLIDLMNVTPTAANVGAYIPLVKQDSQRRGLNELVYKLNNGITNYGISAEELIAQAQTDLQRISEATTKKISNTHDMVTEWLEYRRQFDKNPEKALLSTGYARLDKALGGGLLNGDLYIIGARPSMGKTTFGISIIEHIAAKKAPVYFASLEMTRIELTSKRIAQASGKPYNQILMQKMSESDYKAAFEGIKRIQENTLEISQEPRMTVNDIMTAARKVKGLRCILIDHFSLISPVTRTAKRADDMTLVSNDLKRMAKTLNVPVICLAQLNRENEARSNKRPILSDLRDTGSIEQDADYVIFLHRESVYDPNRTSSEAISDPMEVLIAKARNGTPCRIDMNFCGTNGNIYEVNR